MIESDVVVVSPREAEVLMVFMIDGADNETLCRKLGIHRDTVKTHMRRLFEKTGVRNRTALALAVERGHVRIAIQ